MKDKLNFVGDYEKSDKLMATKASVANTNDEAVKKSEKKSDKLKNVLK